MTFVLLIFAIAVMGAFLFDVLGRTASDRARIGELEQALRDIKKKDEPFYAVATDPPDLRRFKLEDSTNPVAVVRRSLLVGPPISATPNRLSRGSRRRALKHRLRPQRTRSAIFCGVGNALDRGKHRQAACLVTKAILVTALLLFSEVAHGAGGNLDTAAEFGKFAPAQPRVRATLTRSVASRFRTRRTARRAPPRLRKQAQFRATIMTTGR